MDKKIKKLKRKIDKGMNALVKEDIPRDRKIEKCDKAMKSKKKSKEFLQTLFGIPVKD